MSKKITDEEYKEISERFYDTGYGSKSIERIDKKTLRFYAYHLCYHDSESIKAIDPNNQYNIEMTYHGGHDEGHYGRITKR